MKTRLSTIQPYKSLIVSIKSVLKDGLLAAQKTLEYQRLKTYWQIGEKIKLYGSSSGKKAMITQALYHDLSRDIESELGLVLSADILSRMVHFYQEYPKFPQKTPLTFTHYLALLRIADPAQRKNIEQKAIQEDWSSVDIKMAITKLNVQNDSPQSTLKILEVKRGEPYVYAVHRYVDLLGNKDLGVDCGFKIDVPLNGMIVQSTVSTVSDDTRGVRVIKKDGHYNVQLNRESAGKLYTYAATVKEVIDGDTLDLRIDVGFSIKLYDRMRLSGIDAPEMNTQEGKLAKQFLIDYLSHCPLIVVRTTKQKEEIYGRWLADIFVIKNCSDPYKIAAEGELLNNILLTEGLAKLYK